MTDTLKFMNKSCRVYRHVVAALIEREIDGQKVLVPQVYARLKEGDLAPSGAVLARRRSRQ